MKQQKERGCAVCDEAEPCLYCGRPTFCQGYIINPGAKHELRSCSDKCLEKARLFVGYDMRWRPTLYVVLLVLAVANLLIFESDASAWWKYLPMLGMSIAFLACPLVFTRYERYQGLGIRKTQRIIRIVAGSLAAFSIALMIGC